VITKGIYMSNKYVEEAPYHPGYEDVGFKDETSRLAAEIDRFRKSNARYLSFADVIVDFCASGHHRPNAAK
jgi:hypothetical protein